MADTRPSPRPSSGSRPRAWRVLVADDSDDTRTVYSAVLAFAGFVVEQAADGGAAVDKALSFRPDVIVLDYTMPVLDGGGVMQQLASDVCTRDIPIVMSSAFGEGVPREVRQACAVFLTKPCDLDHLVAVVGGLALQRGSGPLRAYPG